MSYKIIVPGRPVPKQRPRVNMTTGIVYTPNETKRYERMIGFLAKERIKQPLDGDVAVKISVYTYKRMDLDNVAKSILDGLNKIAYSDDRQVKKLTIEMFDSEDERAEIEIKKLQLKNKEMIKNDKD